MMGCIAHGLTMFCALGLAPLWFLMSLLVTLGLISPTIPLYSIRAACQSPSHLSSSECSSPSLSTKIDWSRISVDDVDRYCHMVHHLLPSPPLEAVNCCRSDCSEHLDLLDSFAQSLLSTLVSSSSLCFPCVSPSPPKIPGWNDGTRKLREMSIFWHKVWVEAGCPSAGVLFNIKCNTKSRFKYAVRRLKRRKEYLIREKFASSFTSRKKDRFWCEVRRLNRVRKPIAPCVELLGPNILLTCFPLGLRAF